MSGPASSSDPLLAALRARGARIRRVRYRANRSVLLSVSRDGRTLNSHSCFREAPAEIADAVARFITARRGSTTARQALTQVRTWEGTRRGLEAARRARPRRRPAALEAEPRLLRALFDRFNRERFDGFIPPVPLRASRRMTRSLGTIRYTGHRAGGRSGRPDRRDGARGVEEIAISADLLAPTNRHVLEDTVLHEMAHAEAWLRHGHRGHGRPWRRIAERVGCAPRATCRLPIVRRRNGRS